MIPWLTIVVPTIGRSELVYTLDSMDAQAEHGSVQVLVVGDTHSGMTPALEAAKAHVQQRGNRYRWLEHDGGQHCWGQPQRQYGMEQAAAQWIAFSADDNIMTPGAISSIWQAIIQLGEPRPLLFRVRTWQAGVLWRHRSIENGNIDADCFVVPNAPERLGRWQNQYNGDFHFMQATAAKWSGGVVWRDELIALARPQPNEFWWTTTRQLTMRSFVPRHVSV